MVDYQDFSCFVDNLKNIYSNENLIKYDLQQKYSNKLNSVIEEINILYKKESEYTYENYITPFIDKYSFLQTPSILDAINKLQYETFHSLILKELWNPKNGKQLLSNFISTIDGISLSENEKIKMQELFCREIILSKKNILSKKIKNGLIYLLRVTLKNGLLLLRIKLMRQ